MREVGQSAHQTLAPAPLDRLAPLHLQPQLLQVTQQDPPLPFGSWQSILLRFRSILKPRLTIAEPHSVLAQHIADGCRWACQAALPRIGLTTGCVGVDPGLVLTVYLVTVR